MSKVEVGIAAMEISDNPDTVLTAPHLGSCIGVCAYDRSRKIAGLIHCLLPMSKSDPEKAKAKPYMYVDTGVVAMLSELVKRGCKKDELEIYVAGGSQINDPNNVFEIGKKNFTILRRVLWKNSLLIQAEDVGEDCSRTLAIEVGSGKVTLKKLGKEILLREV